MSDATAKHAVERVSDQSPDFQDELLDQLRAVAPEVFTEGKLDLEKLRQLTGGAVDDKPERFLFGWAGKRDAIAMLQAPTSATLIPDTGNSVGFDAAQHVFIEGENLETQKILHRAYFGRVNLIYIDPPYNTGSDFIYPDKFADPLEHYLRITGQKGGNGEYLTTLTERNGHIHSAWLSMMYPRLVMARQLITESGLIFVSIDDNDVHNLRRLMSEIFGEENFIAEIVWKKAYGGGAKAKYVVGHHEYALCFARNKSMIKRIDLPPNPETRRYYKFKDEKFKTRGPYRKQPLWTNSMDERKNLRYPIIKGGEEIWSEKQWQWARSRAENAQKNNELEFVKSEQNGWSVYYKQYLYDQEGEERSSKLFSLLDGPYTQAGTDELEKIFGDGKVFPFPKPSGLIKKFVSTLWREDSAIVLDFFAGSCPIGQAIFEFNDELGKSVTFVAVQLPEPTPEGSAARKLGLNTIADIGRERLRKGMEASAKTGGNAPTGFRAFRLADSSVRRWTGVEAKDAEAYAEQLDAFADTLVDGWKPEDVIWEVALREGFALTSEIEKHEVEGQTIWRVTDSGREQSFHICLDDTLSVEAVRALGLTRENLFVCRDKALNDTLAANLALQCRLKVL